MRSLHLLMPEIAMTPKRSPELNLAADLATTTARTIARLFHCIAAALVVGGVSACKVVDNKTASTKQDTGATPAVVPESARGSVTIDSTLASPTAIADSAARKIADDTGVVRLYPPEPRRGGVLFALAEGVATPTPRCTWKSAPTPCYHTNDGTLVAIPLPADEDAGTFTLTIDRPAGRIVRQIAVADRDFGRELIFLTDSLYKRATSTREIARDARAVRGMASVESSEQHWTGRWREPVSGMKSAGYGVERYYYRASDSTRSISLDTQTKTRGTFAADTNDVAPTGAPSWRHAGIDLPARRGTSVSAPANGVVVDVGNYVLSGKTVLIDHGQGAVSAYFHLDTAVVSKGDVVHVGDRIGRVGATGLATGPHLHYGIYLHGKDVDPLAWRDMPKWLIVGADTSSAQR
jgi:murein DD-endopeptidase MepM/ murein hydrolase activator NlpD